MIRDWMPIATESGTTIFVDAKTATVEAVGNKVVITTPNRDEVPLHKDIGIDAVMAALDGDERARILIDPGTGDFDPPSRWWWLAVATLATAGAFCVWAIFYG